MIEYTTWKRDDPNCGGCGKPFPEETLTWMPRWNFSACPPCVVLCNAVDVAEDAEVVPPTCNGSQCSWCEPFGCVR